MKLGKTDCSETGSAKLNYTVNLGQQWKPTCDCFSLLMVLPLLQHYIRPLTGKRKCCFIVRRDNWCSCISFETDKFRNLCPLDSADIWYHTKTSQPLWGFSHELPYGRDPVAEAKNNIGRSKERYWQKWG